MNGQLIEELQNIVGPEQVLTSPEDLICYSYDGTFTEHQPDVVAIGKRFPWCPGAWAAAWLRARYPFPAALPSA
jgi:hypothetical protein